MEEAERQRKQRMSLAQEFLRTIDAWAKTKAGTEEASLLAPFIERIAPIVTAFAIGNAQVREPPCKDPHPRTNTVTIAGPKVIKPAEGPNLALPKRPQETKFPWVTIARKAAKLPSPPKGPTFQKPTSQKKPAEQDSLKEDKRLFLRLALENEWRKLSLATIKKIITERAGVAPSAILAMSQVRSGLAIECASDVPRESILRVASALEKDNLTIEAASNWTSVIVPHVPLFIRTLDCRLAVTKEMVIKEYESACGVTPVQVRPNNVKEGQYTTSWIIHFKQKPANLKFRLFEESGPTMPFVRRRPIEQCQKCWDFHATRSCVKGSRC
ncbi:hypothetical protein K3495_g11956 [Podosphaera aphanis]|nr:hypothetical protein K3495_g11956 [Podosphaera aphanis]